MEAITMVSSQIAETILGMNKMLTDLVNETRSTSVAIHLILKATKTTSEKVATARVLL